MTPSSCSGAVQFLIYQALLDEGWHIMRNETTQKFFELTELLTFPALEFQKGSDTLHLRSVVLLSTLVVHSRINTQRVQRTKFNLEKYHSPHEILHHDRDALMTRIHAHLINPIPKMEQLPPELNFHIGTYLDAQALGRMGQVSRTLRRHMIILSSSRYA